ncbi:MAG: hypothetical protein JWO97_1866 [Acidobacteria bacterium]|nr:hypothetical protein [Acidobacteriota bacterium]
MASDNNPIVVQVTITPTEITVDKPSVKANQGRTPLIWRVAGDSTEGAQITGVVFHADWPNPQPRQAGNEWIVTNNNTNGADHEIRYKYDVAGTTPLGNPPVLDPTVDNQPPPTDGTGGP